LNISSTYPKNSLTSILSSQSLLGICNRRYADIVIALSEPAHVTHILIHRPFFCDYSFNCNNTFSRFSTPEYLPSSFVYSPTHADISMGLFLDKMELVYVNVALPLIYPFSLKRKNPSEKTLENKISKQNEINECFSGYSSEIFDKRSQLSSFLPLMNLNYDNNSKLHSEISSTEQFLLLPMSPFNCKLGYNYYPSWHPVPFLPVVRGIYFK
jgi:hypothetical protein